MTQPAKHTPLHLSGEYLPDGSGVGDGVPCYICTEDGRQVAQIYRKHPQAKVLAPKLAAAPAMYEALREIVEALGSGEVIDYSSAGDWYTEACAVLAQAEGR